MTLEGRAENLTSILQLTACNKQHTWQKLTPSFTFHKNVKAPSTLQHIVSKYWKTHIPQLLLLQLLTHIHHCYKLQCISNSPCRDFSPFTFIAIWSSHFTRWSDHDFVDLGLLLQPSGAIQCNLLLGICLSRGTGLHPQRSLPTPTVL